MITQSVFTNGNNVPVDCVVSAWSYWDECYPLCGTKGTRIRSRTILTPGANGGTPCPTFQQLYETEECPTLVGEAQNKNNSGTSFKVEDTNTNIKNGFVDLNSYSYITSIAVKESDNQTIILSALEYINSPNSITKFTGKIVLSDTLTNFQTYQLQLQTLQNEAKLKLQTDYIDQNQIKITNQQNINYTPTLVVAGLDATGMYISCNITNSTTTDPSQFIYIWSVTPTSSISSVTFTGNNSYIVIRFPTTIQTVTCNVYYGSSEKTVTETITING